MHQTGNQRRSELRLEKSNVTGVESYATKSKTIDLDPRFRQLERSGGRTNVTCYRCQEPGHIATNCQKKRAEYRIGSKNGKKSGAVRYSGASINAGQW